MKLFQKLMGLAFLLPLAGQAQDLEPFHYSENFERRMLGAWASYPHWQDIAYDQNFRVNEIVPGDKNISVVQLVTPYTAVDNYAGAQKLMDAVLTPTTKLRFRYYIKTNQKPDNLIIRWAADTLGKIDHVINNPVANQWKWVDLSYADFVAQNPSLQSRDRVQIHALAFLTKISNADPAMPIYFSLDDIELSAMQHAKFRFEQPAVEKLSEFPAYIATKAYTSSAGVQWKGKWNGDAKQIVSEITAYTGKTVLQKLNWKKEGDSWTAALPKEKLPVGLYKARTIVYNRAGYTNTTEMVFRIAPEQYGGHPRLLFDENGKQRMIQAFNTPEYKHILDEIMKKARDEREKLPPSKLVFDLDQFPDENWLPTWASWGGRIYSTAEALRMNARAYAFGGDKEAGEYVRAVLVKLASWPNWTHPWQTKRGRFSEHRTGSWAHRVAEAYDLAYHAIPENERAAIRKAIRAHIIDGAFKTYVIDDNITGATSNWLAMTLGGALINLAAIAGDGPDADNIEVEIAGSVFKLNKMLHHVVDSIDGAWGEGLGYNNYSMSNLAYSLPSVERVFGVDMSAPIRHSYREFLWGGIIQKKHWFEYGDSGGDMGPINNWAFLVEKYRDPLLHWYYNFMKVGANKYADQKTQHWAGYVNTTKPGATYEDVIYNLKDIPQKPVFEENPVKAFRHIGTTVFKSGWDSTDMVFVMRTGPFYNHQHIDQGSFWFADKGDIFIEERHLKNSNYYDDPIYQSHLIQPIGHSTILIDGNEQSQRVGDHRSFAKGFDDYAYLAAFVDGKNSAFSSGDIGRLYWGKVKSLRRNVLYLKPRVIVMMDVAEPNGKDVSVDLLYQTLKLANIKPDAKASSIKGANSTLTIKHVYPANMKVEAKETPHYLKTLLSPQPLEREGLLQVSAQTQGKPTVVVNILSTNNPASLNTNEDSEKISGQIEGQDFVINKNPGTLIQAGAAKTDALCASWADGAILLGLVKQYSSEAFSLQSTQVLALETDGKTYISYSAEAPGVLTLTIGKGKTRKISFAAGEHRIFIK
jgi:hypothetical protein